MSVPTNRVKRSYSNKSIYAGIKYLQNVERQNVSKVIMIDRLRMKLEMKKQALEQPEERPNRILILNLRTQ